MQSNVLNDLAEAKRRWTEKNAMVAKIQQDLITTTSRAPNVARVGLTPRRAFNKLKPKNTTAVTAKPSVPFPHRKHKGNKLSVQLSCLARATCIVWSSPVSAVPCY